MMQTEIAIIGAGVCGLWCARQLELLGYDVTVLEKGRDLASQSPAAQGIIHAGVKYRLPGIGDGASKAVSSAAATWDELLAGNGAIDLSGVEVLSDHTHLWSTGGMASNTALKAAASLMRSGVRRLARDEAPDWFRAAGDDKLIYRVEERVVSPVSLLNVLAGGLRSPVRRAEVTRITESSSGVVIETGRGELAARTAIVSAGAGAESIDAPGAPRMQRRPLHMGVVTGAPVPIFGHCLGASNVPRLTITTASDRWYVGGGPAEKGVGLGPDEQSALIRRELGECLDWLDLSGLEISTFRIDRAEGLAGGKRPDGPFVKRAGSVVWTWPTKMVLAPEAAQRVIETLDAPEAPGSTGSGPDLPEDTGVFSHWEPAR